MFEKETETDRQGIKTEKLKRKKTKKTTQSPLVYGREIVGADRILSGNLLGVNFTLTLGLNTVLRTQ